MTKQLSVGLPVSSVASEQGLLYAPVTTTLELTRHQTPPGLYLARIGQTSGLFRRRTVVRLFAERLRGGRWRAVEEVVLQIAPNGIPNNSLVLVTLGNHRQVESVEEAESFLVTLLNNLSNQEHRLQEQEAALLESSLQQQVQLAPPTHEPVPIAARSFWTWD